MTDVSIDSINHRVSVMVNYKMVCGIGSMPSIGSDINYDSKFCSKGIDF